MAFQILTTTAASITELKRDPMGTFNCPNPLMLILGKTGSIMASFLADVSSLAGSQPLSVDSLDVYKAQSSQNLL